MKKLFLICALITSGLSSAEQDNVSTEQNCEASTNDQISLQREDNIGLSLFKGASIGLITGYLNACAEKAVSRMTRDDVSFIFIPLLSWTIESNFRARLSNLFINGGTTRKEDEALTTAAHLASWAGYLFSYTSMTDLKKLL